MPTEDFERVQQLIEEASQLLPKDSMDLSSFTARICYRPAVSLLFRCLSAACYSLHFDFFVLTECQ